MSASKDAKLTGQNEATGWPHAEIAQTFVSGLAQAQCEAAHLASRRARAWLELPQTLSGCRTLPELAECQARFLQGFWSDWMQASQQMSAGWSQVMAKPMQAMAEAAPVSRAAPREPEADPFAIWEWWRTDLKAIKPRRSETSPTPGNRSDTH